MDAPSTELLMQVAYTQELIKDPEFNPFINPNIVRRVRRWCLVRALSMPKRKWKPSCIRCTQGGCDRPRRKIVCSQHFRQSSGTHHNMSRLKSMNARARTRRRRISATRGSLSQIAVDDHGPLACRRRGGSEAEYDHPLAFVRQPTETPTKSVRLANAIARSWSTKFHRAPAATSIGATDRAIVACPTKEDASCCGRG